MTLDVVVFWVLGRLHSGTEISPRFEHRMKSPFTDLAHVQGVPSSNPHCPEAVGHVDVKKMAYRFRKIISSQASFWLRL
jgi:hypothetical protein